jgi:hypothetical protein
MPGVIFPGMCGVETWGLCDLSRHFHFSLKAQNPYYAKLLPPTSSGSNAVTIAARDHVYDLLRK